ncbi:MAG: HAD superfamily hydrolase (TIGR01509 family) [Halioglobus sp.]|jgi:beta-phosphoglucomutase
MIDTILFDMDGVICHTNPHHSKAFQAFFQKRGMDPSEEEYAAHMYGKSNSYIFSHFLGRTVSGDELQAYEDEKEGLFREIYAEHVKPIDGYLDFLNLLVDKKYKLGVATSAPIANMDLILDTLDIRDVFGSTLASEDVTVHKPDPQVYLKSAKNLSADSNECLVFEDSHAGVSAAINAKMGVVGVLSSHTESELPPCIKHIHRYETSLVDFISHL